DHHHVALVQLAGQLEVILHGDKRFRVTVKTDMADACTGDHGQHAVQNSGACTQDGDEHQLLAVDDLPGRIFQRRLDLDVVHGHIPQHLVGHQGGDLVQKLTKTVGGSVFSTHQGELVLDQRVADQMYGGHGPRRPCRRWRPKEVDV